MVDGMEYLCFIKTVQYFCRAIFFRPGTCNLTPNVIVFETNKIKKGTLAVLVRE